jgi:Hypothetical glycosyl hydrolase family 15
MRRWPPTGLVLGVLVLAAGAVGCPAGSSRSCEGRAGDDAGCDPGTATMSPSPSRSAVFRAWAPANERIGTVSPRDALDAATHFDLIVMSPTIERMPLAAMGRIDPHLRLLVYMNAAFAQSSEGDTYPDSWYARDAHGSKIRSVDFGNWLMDVSERGWIRDRATRCERLLATAPFEGCMLDLLGTTPLHPGYATGIPIDERTHEAWRERDWLDATSSLAGTVERLVRPAIIVGNGLGNGARFFDPAAPSSLLVDGVHGGIAEGWLRPPREDLDAFPSVSEWLLDIEMLSNVGTDGKAVLVLTKAWAEGTERQKDRWHAYALASFLLGMEGNAYFHFSYSPRSDPIRWHPWWDLDIGRAIGSYGIVDGIYRRPFTRGLVLVNPSAETRTMSLEGEFVDLRGASVRSATLPAHTGLVLQR